MNIEELFNGLPTFETERLRLVPVESDHTDQLFELYSDPAVMRYMGEVPHSDEAATEREVTELLARHEQHTGISWCVFPRDEERLIGKCGLHSILWNNRRAHIGFHVTSKYWRRGFMTEALGTVVAFAFASLELIKVAALTLSENEPTHSFLLRFGFRQEGLLRHHALFDGEPRDLRAYGLLAHEFERLRKGVSGQ